MFLKSQIAPNDPKNFSSPIKKQNNQAPEPETRQPQEGLFYKIQLWSIFKNSQIISFEQRGDHWFQTQLRSLGQTLCDEVDNWSFLKKTS